MDDVDSKDFDTKDFGSEELDPLIIYGESSAISGGDDKPIPFDDETTDTEVSHSPLNLGGGSTAEVSEFEAAAQPVEFAAKKPGEKITSSPERITGVKTFFTKLHPGAMDFLDKQITNWLKNNPGLVIKRTNTATGEVQGKKTEPNIIITIWY
ncbi:MAG: hypothetical protein ACYS76_14360 [Planctomycetota bacterium]